MINFRHRWNTGRHLCSFKKLGGHLYKKFFLKKFFFQMYERYHSGGKRNRNSTHKEIYYKLTAKCGIDNKCGTNERCWKEAKSKYLKNKTYYIRQRKH